MSGEATGRNGRQTMGEGVKDGHTTQPVTQGTSQRRRDVHPPEMPGGVGNTRRQLVVFHWPRRLGLEQAHAANVQHG